MFHSIKLVKNLTISIRTCCTAYWFICIFLSTSTVNHSSLNVTNLEPLSPIGNIGKYALVCCEENLLPCNLYIFILNHFHLSAPPRGFSSQFKLSLCVLLNCKQYISKLLLHYKCLFLVSLCNCHINSKPSHF